MKLFVIFYFLVVLTLSNAQFEGESCIVEHNQNEGVCKNANQCPQVYEIYRQGLPFKTCAYSLKQHIVCCPIERVTQPVARPVQNQQNSGSGKRISELKCDQYKSSEKKVQAFAGLTANPVIHQVSADTCDTSSGLIVGGKVTRKGEFPHMAALGFRGPLSIEFYCGGSLISNLFVLTAAHCKNRNQGNFARLGDQNLRSTSDGVSAIDIPIAIFIKHENYKKSLKQNDIALVKLSQSVKFTNHIRPACLWGQNSIGQSNVIATGWGFTEYNGDKMSDELLKVKLNILSNDVCTEALEESNFVLNESNICAGVLGGGKDTCQGDSGGPIQIVLPNNQCIYHIVGVTSFGAGCGLSNSPSVYTRVSSHLAWIEQRVWG